MKEIHKDLVSLLRFGTVGVLNTLIHCIAIFILSSNGFESIAYGIGYALSAINSFLFNKYWTFKKKDSTNVTEIIKFIITNICSAIFGNFLYTTFGNMFVSGNIITYLIIFLHMDENHAKWLISFITTTPFITIISYCLNRFWVFKKSQGRGTN